MQEGSVTTTAEPDPGRPHRRARWWLVATAVVILVLLVTAFVVWRLAGGGDLQRLAGAPDATVEAGTARVAVVLDVEGVPVLGPFTLTVAEGEADLVEQRARLRREVPGVAQVPFLNRLLPEPVELIHDEGETYLRLPVDGEQSWVRLGDEQRTGPAATAPALTNPVAALALLRVLDGMPEVIGEEAVRGQPSTQFRVVVDLDRAADALAGRAEDVARTLRRLRGRNDLPMDVWLDDDDRVTRLRYTLRPDLAGMPRVTVTNDMELYDFGTAVDITAPDPADIVDAPSGGLGDFDPLELLERLGGFLNR